MFSFKLYTLQKLRKKIAKGVCIQETSLHLSQTIINSYNSLAIEGDFCGEVEAIIPGRSNHN